MVASMDATKMLARQSNTNTPSTEGSGSAGEEREDTIITVAEKGNLVLRVSHQIKSTSTTRSFRVSSSVLSTSSRYFERLLQSGRFGEAAKIETHNMILREQYVDIEQVPSDELPVVDIQDLGRVSVKSIESLLTDFFSILHGIDTPTSLPVANLANLAIVADRFDALNAVKSYVRRKKIVRTLDGKTTPKQEAAITEEKVRQRLLIGIMLDYGPWVEQYSTRIILKGWVGREVDTDTALWWDLPSRIEEELAYRRESILETVQSLQSHFLKLYTSKERQCKLGYDSSVQCDSFQLGEMIRFFTRIGTLQLHGALADADPAREAYLGDMSTLLETLRQVPEYQIDRFHSHCGVRTRILPHLQVIETCLQYIGICGDCWHENRTEHAWIESKRPLLWKERAFRKTGHPDHARIDPVRDMFTAAEHDWN